MKRRHFIQTTALASAGAVFYGCGSNPTESNVEASQTKADKTIGLQLYSLRDVIKQDVKGTMQSVADIGFKEIECYDYNNGSIFGLPYPEFAKMVADMGMRIVSGHYKTGQADPEFKGSLTNNWQMAVEDAAKVGQSYLTIASMDIKERGSIDQVKNVCELLNKGNQVCKENGVKLAYHNHEYEFEMLDGQVPYDVMLSELDSSIAMELDLYWITFAGKDPIEYFAKYPGRFQQWHVKDMNKNDRKLQADVGTGSIDFKAIFAKAELAGMRHYYVEQENYEVSPMSSITNGYEYLETL